MKGAGKKKFDMIAANITIVGEDRSRESFSTGFNLNFSHSGTEATRTVRPDLAKRAVLTGNTSESLLEMIDFLMTDRAADNDVMLDELSVEERKRLKCNAHVILCIGAVLEKTFRDMEYVIGRSKLISEGATHVFSSKSNSMWYCLFAIAKLVSLSHEGIC